MMQVPDPFAEGGLLAQVLNRLPVPLGVFDQKGNTVFVNQACLETFNVRGPEELVGKFNVLKDPICCCPDYLSTCAEHRALV